MATGGGGVDRRSGSPYSSQVSSDSESDSSISTSSSSTTRDGRSVSIASDDVFTPAHRERLSTQTDEVLRYRRRPVSARSTTSSTSHSSELESTSTTSLEETTEPKSTKRSGQYLSKRAALTDKYKKRRSENRSKLAEMSDLKTPGSRGVEFFKATTGLKDPQFAFMEHELDFLQDEMRRQLEPHINRDDFEVKALTILPKVIAKGGLGSQLLPELDQWHRERTGNPNAPMILSQLSPPAELVTVSPELAAQDPEQVAQKAELKVLWAQLQHEFKSAIPALRTCYFDEILKEGTMEEQVGAYDRLERGIQDRVDRLKSLITELKRLSVAVQDQSGFMAALEQGAEGVVAKLESQQETLEVYKRSDFRYQQAFIEEMALTMASVETFLKSDLVKDISQDLKPKSKQAKALKELGDYIKSFQLPKNPQELSPTIVADMKLIKEWCLDKVEEAGTTKEQKKALKHALKDQLRDDRMQLSWESVVEEIPARAGLHQELFESSNEPVEAMFGRVGSVPSTAQGVEDKPCNAWGHKLRSIGGRGILNKCLRSAVPTPYELKKEKGVKDTERAKELAKARRENAAAERARQQLISNLLLEFDGSAEKLEEALGTPDKAAECPMMVISYLTTDKTRHRTGKHDDEFTMQLEAVKGFGELTTKKGELRELAFTDKEGKPRKIFLKPKLAPVACACNDLALTALKYVMFPWELADKLNQSSVEDVTGSELPEEPVGGWAGEYLADYELKYKRPHPHTELVENLVNEWRIMLLLEEQHEAQNDTFKPANFPAAIAMLLREDNPFVMDDIDRALRARSRERLDTITEEPTDEVQNDQSPTDSISSLSGTEPEVVPYRLPIQVFGFCKSGKDRTGAGMGSLDRFLVEIYLNHLTAIGEPVPTLDRRFNAQNFALFVQMKIQHKNGAMGYKTNGEDNLVGSTVKKARKHSSKSTVTVDEATLKKKKSIKKKGTVLGPELPGGDR